MCIGKAEDGRSHLPALETRPQPADAAGELACDPRDSALLPDLGSSSE